MSRTNRPPMSISRIVSVAANKHAAEANQGKTIVVVLHDINFASAYADRIVAMCDGKVAHEGPVSTVITEEVVEAVFGLPVMIREIEGQRTCLFRR